MNAAAIRDRLYDYVRVADVKKIKAIYTMLEDTITEDSEWWKDAALVAGLDKSVAGFSAGTEKGYSLTEIKATIAGRKKKVGK